MSSQVGYAANSITLHFDVRTEHLANQRLEAAEFYNEELVLS